MFVYDDVLFESAYTDFYILFSYNKGIRVGVVEVRFSTKGK